MPLFFVPARSSRHRIACFALYRSLLRQGLLVPLPNDLTTASPLGPINPIKTLIRNAFRRNKRDTSPRLVVSALKNGYRFLTLLSRAADPSTPEHTSVLTFLRENETRVLALKARNAAAAASRISTAPIEGRTTLLTKISADGDPPVYTPTSPPRPLSTFRSGVRKPPTLGVTTGVPFLRLKKPQPRFLERVVRQKSLRRAKRIVKILEMEGGGMEEAKLEDEWESLVGGLLAFEKEKGKGRGEMEMKKGGEGETMLQGSVWDEWEGLMEGVSAAVEREEKGRRKRKGGKGETTFQESVWDAVVYLSDLSNKEQDDLVARGQAMWKMVLAEREMALQEEKERLVGEGRGDEEPKLRDWRRPIHKRRQREKGEKTAEQAAGSGTSEQP